MTNNNQDSRNEETIIIEWSTSQKGLKNVSRDDAAFEKMQQQSDRALNIAMANIRTMARKVTDTISSMSENAQPDSAEIEFGLNLDAEAGAFLTKASAGAQLTVKLKWGGEKGK